MNKVTTGITHGAHAGDLGKRDVPVLQEIIAQVGVVPFEGDTTDEELEAGPLVPRIWSVSVTTLERSLCSLSVPTVAAFTGPATVATIDALTWSATKTLAASTVALTAYDARGLAIRIGPSVGISMPLAASLTLMSRHDCRTLLLSARSLQETSAIEYTQSRTDYPRACCA